MERILFISLGVLVMNFLTTSSAINAVSKNNTGDLDSLLAFKAAIFDPDNIIPLNWLTSTSVCNWIGITCNARHQRVAAIDLPRFGLVGTIPPQLGNLSFLVRLNLVNNSFHGELPMELAYLRRLKYIDLAGNDFNIGFPTWLGALPELQVLSFSHNRFSGSLSSVIASLTKLEILELSHNSFTGTIPKEYRALQKLKRLNVEFNQLSGPLPPALFNLSSLQVFSLSNNSLSGYLPEGMCNHLPQLRWLGLSMNEFHGRIPQGIGQCSGLEIISISQNNFSGQIPGGVTNLTALRRLFLGYTNIEGEIPKDIGNLRNLEVLSAPDTHLTEYGSSGLVSKWCDVYSFGITLMETFTGRRPKDEMFTEEQSIRNWIQELIPDSVIRVIDANLLQPEDEFAMKKIACLLSVLQLSLSCTVDVPDERINIKDVLIALQKIKLQFLQSNNNCASV